MAGSMKAKIEIGLDTSKIKSGSKEATQSFDKIASGAKSALGKVDARADKAGNKIKQVGNEGKIAGSKVKQGAEKGAQGMNKLGNEAKKAERDIGGVAISVLGLGASITGLSDTIFGMKEKLVALERSSFGLERTTEDMKRMQEDFDEAVQAGTMTAKEHARALKDLELGYKDMAVEVKEIEAETEAMNSEWISFAVNTATTVVFSLTTITTALGAERTAKLGSALAGVVLTKSTKAFANSLWLVVKHPVFLVVAGALAIWESNLFGVRTEVEKLLGVGDLGILSNIQKAFDTGIPEAGAETIDSLQSIEDQTKQLQESFDETTTQSNRGIIPMITDVGDCSIKSSKKVDSLSDSLDNLKKKQETFRADYLVAETRFQEQVTRIKNKSASPQASKSGLSALVNYNKLIGGSMGFGHALTNKMTKGMDHWNGGASRYATGGDTGLNDKRIFDQNLYNNSISGYDNNSTKGWSASSMQTLRNFKARVSQMNAESNARHENEKRQRKIGRQKMYEYADEWNLKSLFRGRFPKADMRSIPRLVNETKRRVARVARLGYGTPTNLADLARAEYQIEQDRENWQTKTGMKESTISQLHEAGRSSDIFNVINHRQRLGLISSGVI